MCGFQVRFPVATILWNANFFLVFQTNHYIFVIFSNKIVGEKKPYIFPRVKIITNYVPDRNVLVTFLQRKRVIFCSLICARYGLQVENYSGRRLIAGQLHRSDFTWPIDLQWVTSRRRKQFLRPADANPSIDFESKKKRERENERICFVTKAARWQRNEGRHVRQTSYRVFFFLELFIASFRAFVSFGCQSFCLFPLSFSFVFFQSTSHLFLLF